MLTSGKLIEHFWYEMRPANLIADTVQQPAGADCFSHGCAPLEDNMPHYNT